MSPLEETRLLETGTTDSTDQTLHTIHPLPSVLDISRFCLRLFPNPRLFTKNQGIGFHRTRFLCSHPHPHHPPPFHRHLGHFFALLLPIARRLCFCCRLRKRIMKRATVSIRVFLPTLLLFLPLAASLPSSATSPGRCFMHRQYTPANI